MDHQTATLEEGIEAFKQGNYELAIKLLEPVSRHDSDSYEAFVYLGAAYAQVKRYNAAIGALRRACEIRPDSAKVHYNLGQAYEAANVPQEAVFEYQKALEIDKNYNLAKSALASLLRRLPNLYSEELKFAA